jgi:Right handed beta helix region
VLFAPRVPTGRPPAWGITSVLSAAVLLMLALSPPAHAACSTTRVTSLVALASQVRAGHSVCLADGSYTGNVDLSNASGTRAIVTQEGAAVLHGQVRLNSSHLALDGLALDNTEGTGAGADCVRIQTVGGTDIAITDSDIGSCARDAIRMAYNRGRHDTAVTIARNNLHGAGWNACTCYMRGGLFMDNLVQDIHNDGLDLWGDSNVLRHNTFRNLIARPATNHNDVVQTWQVRDDPATGDPLTNLVFDRNVVDTVAGPDSHGLMIRGGSANNALTIESNLFRDIGSIGMLFDGAVNVRLYANTFVRAGATDSVEWKDGSSGAIRSNLLYQAVSAGPQPWYRDLSSNPSHAYNLAWGGKLLSDEATGLNADPQFYDREGTLDTDRLDDFSLSAGSPAVDRGDPSVASRIDIPGRSISGFRLDIGAFEHPTG